MGGRGIAAGNPGRAVVDIGSVGGRGCGGGGMERGRWVAGGWWLERDGEGGVKAASEKGVG